ncbi:MAG: RNA methyltransferase [Chlorobi bacterium]|nr:RNA methyltransferase [Chlorobiota bacterium]
MITKNEIKFVRSLQRKRERDEHNCFVAEGEKIVAELLNSEFIIKSIYTTKSWKENNRLNNLNIPVKEIKIKELNAISSLKTPNKVIAIVEKQNDNFNINNLTGELTLILDRIQDPGNLGTIIRIADWFGIKSIICSPDSVDVYNSKVIQASMGSVFRVDVFYKDLKVFLKNIKSEGKLLVYGTLLNGENIYSKSLKNEGIIIIGNESEGISKEILPFIDEQLLIPSFSTNKNQIESLNVAVATAIICSEFRRK